MVNPFVTMKLSAMNEVDDRSNVALSASIIRCLNHSLTLLLIKNKKTFFSIFEDEHRIKMMILLQFLTLLMFW